MARQRRKQNSEQFSADEHVNNDDQASASQKLNFGNAMMVGIGTGLLVVGFYFLASNLIWGFSLISYLYESAWYFPFGASVALGFGASVLSQKGIGVSQTWGKIKALWGGDHDKINKSTPRLQTKASKEIIASSNELTNLEQLAENNSQPSRSYLGTIAYYFKVGVATGLTPNGLLILARYVPLARGLFEYTQAAYPGELDDLHNFIRKGKNDKAIELIQLAPQDVIDRMLSRKSDKGWTPFYSAGLVYHKHDVFKAMFNKLSPEQRMKHLLTLNGLGPLEKTFFKALVQDVRRPLDDNMVWQIIMQELSAKEKVTLLTSYDALGDNLFVSRASARNLYFVEGVIDPLSKEQFIDCIKEVCPHGTTPLIETASNLSLEGMKLFLKLLKDEQWLAIMNETPKGWSMTHGEKFLLAAYLSTPRNSDDINYEMAEYLVQKFHLRLPTFLEGLNQEDFEHVIREIRGNQRKTTCLSIHNFKKENEQTPGEILGVEALLPNKSYTRAYRQAQKKHHPDRHLSSGNDEQSKRLNAAIEFIRNPSERKRYLPELSN